jgi:RNA polymerase sigma-70 factor, ECF subfamily
MCSIVLEIFHINFTGKPWVLHMKLRSVTLEASEQNCERTVGEEALLMNETAFADFYHRTLRPFRAYLARVSGNGTLAEDLVQESYLRFLCAKAPWEDGEGACRRYLYRIGTNLLRDHWRRPANTSLEGLTDQDLPSVAPYEIEHLDSEALLNAALLHLRPVERQLLWLAHAEGLSYREISDITSLSVARIRLTLFRSRHKLAQALQQERTKLGELP